jgi:hypothetical protein
MYCTGNMQERTVLLWRQQAGTCSVHHVPSRHVDANCAGRFVRVPPHHAGWVHRPNFMRARTVHQRRQQEQRAHVRLLWRRLLPDVDVAPINNLSVIFHMVMLGGLRWCHRPSLLICDTLFPANTDHVVCVSCRDRKYDRHHSTWVWSRTTVDCGGDQCCTELRCLRDEHLPGIGLAQGP